MRGRSVPTAVVPVNAVAPVDEPGRPRLRGSMPTLGDGEVA